MYQDCEEQTVENYFIKKAESVSGPGSTNFNTYILTQQSKKNLV